MKKQQEQETISSVIIFAIVIMVILAITGCSTTVPVTARFPDAPRLGQGTCPQLKTVSEGVKLSELTNTVAINYSTYYECAVKADQWNEWYAIQKRIFENTK